MQLDTIIETPPKQAAASKAGAEGLNKPPVRLSSIARIFAIDLRSLALFRICFALILLCDLYWRSFDISFFYTDSGVLSRIDALRFQTPFAISIHLASGTWEFQCLLFIIAAVAHIALLLGYRTQLATVASWFLIMSLHRRNSALLQCGDAFIRVLAFWAIFVPLGARWSIDSQEGPNERARTNSILSVGSACILLQVLFLYYFSALLKTGYPWVVDHSAIYYALNVEQLTTPMGRFLLAYPALLTALTICVVKLETFGPLVAVSPFWNDRCRVLAVAAFLSFHIGLAVTMKLGPFPYICMAAWVLFIPTSVWAWLSKFNNDQRAVRDSNPIVESSHMSRLLIWTQGLVLAFFLLNVIFWNVRVLDPNKWSKYYPNSLNFILEFVGLDQQWAMFAPYPLTWDGWFVIYGQTKSGAWMNLSPGAKPQDPINEVKPKEIGALYPNERWRKYLMGLASADGSKYRPLFARAIAAQWTAEHPDDPMRSVDIYFFQKITTAQGPTPPEKILLHQEVLW